MLVRKGAKTSTRGFSKLINFPIPDRAVQDRVMTTAQWPIPYYQRLMKAYPVRERKVANFGTLGSTINENHWLAARHVLQGTKEGREALEHVENEMKLSSEFTRLRRDNGRCRKLGKSLRCRAVGVHRRRAERKQEDPQQDELVLTRNFARPSDLFNSRLSALSSIEAKQIQIN